MKAFNSILLIIVASSVLLGCSDQKSYRLTDGNVIINGENALNSSSTAGNLMATAIKEVNDLDVVLYPSEDIGNAENIMSLSANPENNMISSIQGLFPQYGQRDQFRIGTMKGKDIKAFIYERATEKYTNPFQVAGLKYHIHFVGGVPRFKNFSERRGPLQDNKRYKIAISEYYYKNGEVFPRYEYRNSMSYRFRFSGRKVSARKSLETYLSQLEEMPLLIEERGKVTTYEIGDAGRLTIPQIQGTKFMSAHYGKRVTTRGVITSVANVSWFPKGLEIYIQDPNGDGNPKTSDALMVYIPTNNPFYKFLEKAPDYKIGDMIEVSGVIYEGIRPTGLSLTSIRNVTDLKVLSSGNTLPEATLIGEGGRKIPTKVFSNYNGDLNLKAELDLTQALDFYESLEGMRVAVNNPRILGFRGGKTDVTDKNAKRHLTLYARADGHRVSDNETKTGGIIINEDTDDFNPEIFSIATSDHTKRLEMNHYYKVGDTINGRVEGVFTYLKNLFGGGEYTLVLPEEQQPMNDITIRRDGFKFSDRPKTTLISDENSLTIAAFNIENLPGTKAAEERVQNLARVIETNLKCPDILTLVEVQDDNGENYNGGSSAFRTLNKIITNLNCNANYQMANIDPVVHAEGGQPGGNIRVALIYKADKVGFPARLNPNPLATTVVMSNGSISNNPGRIYPHDPAFRNSRKSIIAEFDFKGEKVFVIGNHLNSKLGDRDRHGAIQPFISGSEAKRVPKSKKLNEFVNIIKKKNPGAHVFVMGDFNANMNEGSMKVLEGDILVNMMRMLPKKERYSTNHNGNSQPLDYIFSTKEILERDARFEVLHINSDYMGRTSDHDPVIGKFNF
ncbi:endonuclease/exonuclease/phosphatase family protein [Bacteriovorax sp. DB6_IX]|uniref:endonuclease/exonuclease/phosphatase family protein n=1 Tax=Bacteriovorax sp. DB6_IX TaxID=1353530 RepID=UPI00038A3A4E|nr:endonuclease/exonuclease/phosphatase family protein [Bacteriovorax sp. DB6_IX]EQC52642.1 endonuclease/exonuclease/phosphatase family protein [Bacteriovorax sp. DB6_IX]